MRFDDPEPTQLLNGYAPHLNRKCVLKLSKRLFRSHAWGICRHADKCAQNWGKCFSMLFFNCFSMFFFHRIFSVDFPTATTTFFDIFFSFINNYNYLLCPSLNMMCYRDSKKKIVIKLLLNTSIILFGQAEHMSSAWEYRHCVTI